MPCPSEDELLDWVAGQASKTDAERLALHADTCALCRETVGTVFAALRSTVDQAETRSPLFGTVSPVSVGDVLAGKYRVLGVIGSGGMGVVLRAQHLLLNQEVALKLIRPELANDLELRARFAREARAAATLRSPHINRVLDLGELPSGIPFMVMELLDGESLESRLKRVGPLSSEQAVPLMRQVLQGLAAAHALQIVHRDLKPANLFMQRSGGVTLLDFGVAKSKNPEIEAGLEGTLSRAWVGSPAFMAPEQLDAAQPVDARTDIWGFGSTFYTALTGTPPFGRDDLLEVAWRIRHQAVPSLPRAVPPWLQGVVARCLAKDPDARFQTAQALSDALTGAERSRSFKKGPVVISIALAGAAVALLFFPRERVVPNARKTEVSSSPAPLMNSEKSPPSDAEPAARPTALLENTIAPSALDNSAEQPTRVGGSASSKRIKHGDTSIPDSGRDEVFGEQH
ncbi:MAG: serine/threonine-protein kinase [Myxococcaceae bacterium]